MKLEKYMLNKKILAASMAAAMTAGLAGQAQAIEVNSGNVGQLLMQPMYFGTDGVVTDLVVVNTRTDAAVLAKVVFRTTDTSAEALDFFIYLTPADTWRGTVVAGAGAGQGAIYSEDDSMLRSASEFASAANPVTQDFQNPAALANAAIGESGNSAAGHIEVIGVYSAPLGDYTVNGDPVLVKRGMAKADLRKLMDATFGQITATPASECGTDTIGSPDARSAVDPCHLMISGTSTIRISDGSSSSDERMSIEMTALSASNYALGNVMVNELGDSNPAGVALPNYVVSNAAYALGLAGESAIGPNMGAAIIPLDTTDHIVAIEWALQATNVSTAWESDSDATSTFTFVQATFPTKYRHKPGTISVCEAHSTNVEDGTTRTVATEFSSPFQNSAVGPVPYALLTCNNSEECNEADPDPIFSGVGEETPVNQFVKEVNLEGATILAGNASGWNNYKLLARNTYDLGTGVVNDTNVCSYPGVPAIATTMKINDGVNLLWEEMGVRKD